MNKEENQENRMLYKHVMMLSPRMETQLSLPSNTRFIVACVFVASLFAVLLYFYRHDFWMTVGTLVGATISATYLCVFYIRLKKGLPMPVTRILLIGELIVSVLFLLTGIVGLFIGDPEADIYLYIAIFSLSFTGITFRKFSRFPS